MESKIDSLDGSPHERGAEKVYVPCLIYICIRLKHKHQIPLEKVAKLQGIFWKGQFAAGTSIRSSCESRWIWVRLHTKCVAEATGDTLQEFTNQIWEGWPSPFVCQVSLY